MKKIKIQKKVNVANEAKRRSRDVVGQIPRSRRIEDKRRKANDRWFRSEVAAWMSKL